MACIPNVPRHLSRWSKCSMPKIASSQVRKAFSTRSPCYAAQNFQMPAMSPTMTEGNIASWKVKEGDKYTTGDVLLEIETDKAQMDVEAQDDGQVAKIIHPNGSKNVRVGTQIAVLADTDDDLSSLSLPAADTSPILSPQEDTKSGIEPSTSSESQAEAPPSSKNGSFESAPQGTRAETPRDSGEAAAKPTKQTYPLYPSIVQLLHKNGLPSSEADKIPSSGPKGRLLKGDVLAYLGRISSSYSADQSRRITRLGHLDLSNIKVAPPPEAPDRASRSGDQELRSSIGKEETVDQLDTEIAVTISLKAVLEVQKRIHSTLGTTLPVSTFIARASELANEDLPRVSGGQVSADELFNAVLGLDQIDNKVSHGHYTPQITALPPTSNAKPVASTRAEADIVDILTLRPSAAQIKPVLSPSQAEQRLHNTVDINNVFSLSVPPGEEQRAKVFLERVKTILQMEPGRLVL